VAFLLQYTRTNYLQDMSSTFADKFGVWKRALIFGVLLRSLLASAAPGSSVSFEVLPVEDGWQPNTITAIVQSLEGYLWLGTYNGLVRFDGVRFTVFNSANSTLPNSRITSLYESHDGTLWIGHETGELTRMAGGQFHPVNLGKNWPGGALEIITADAHEDLWLVNANGLLFRLRDGLPVDCPGGGSPSRKASLARDKNGKLWVAANGLVASLENGKLQPVQFGDAEPGSFYQRVAPAWNEGLWVIGNGRVRKWFHDRWEAEMSPCPCAQAAVTSFVETSWGALLVGTLTDGLYLLAPGAEPLHFNRTNGLSHDWVRSLCEDHEGNIWIGTGGGLDTLRARKVKMLNPPDRWQGRAVLSFAVGPGDNAWMGSEGAGLYHFQSNQWTNYNEANGLANLFVWSVLQTRGGDLFAGTWGGGLLLKNGERFESTGELATITDPVVSMCEGQHGEVWIGTTVGLCRYELASGKITWIATKDQLALPDVRAITQTSDGTIWFGMAGGGLGCLPWQSSEPKEKDAALKQFRKADGLSSDFVMSLCADPDGTLWIGTDDNGLGRFKQGKFAGITEAQGLPSSVISHIVDDGAGNLWISSNHGIFRVSKAELNRCADHKTASVRCLTYGKAEGLATLTCSGGFCPGAAKTPEGLLWFPTTKGLAVIDPANVSTNSIAPSIVIEEFMVDGKPQEVRTQPPGPRSQKPGTQGTGNNQTSPSSTPLKIPPGRDNFSLRYTGLSFTAPDKVRFKYRLEGLEREWMDAGTKRLVQYSYLAPGDYTFHVTACNNDEVWNPNDTTLAFTVLPLFWQTWWFKGSGSLAGAVAVGGVVLWGTRRRVRQKLERLERQRAIERERARIARDIHDDLGASLTRITMLSQSVRSELEGQPQSTADVDQIYNTARELTRAMDEIVWAVNPKHDSLDSLVTYLGRFAQTFLSAAGIRCRLDEPPHLPSWILTVEVRHNVFLAFKEALNNIVKHAAASEVRISFELLSQGFLLTVADNGRGFDQSKLSSPPATLRDGTRLAAGNGVNNMIKRMEEIGGQCEWKTAPGQGTTVKLTVPGGS
jgi:signal transduction histidine kinase/ligand-binding sensor domain-containing protein